MNEAKREKKTTKFLTKIASGEAIKIWFYVMVHCRCEFCHIQIPTNIIIADYSTVVSNTNLLLLILSI